MQLKFLVAIWKNQGTSITVLSFLFAPLQKHARLSATVNRAFIWATKSWH